MNEKPDMARGIYRMTHIAVLGGRRLIAESDMIVIDDVPYAVLEWGESAGQSYPAVKVRLEPNKLSPPVNGKTIYDGEVHDPRAVQ